MPDDDQPTIPTAMPQGSRASAPGVWQAPSVDHMQAVLPQYEVLEILGRGGMGAVYKARQRSLKRLVAIKILPLEAADDELKFAERFQNEAQTMAAMNHPSIVSVHDFGETTDGLLYIVMEFVDGTDVQQLLQASGKLTGDHALSITAHVCDALDYAHKRGVIHRDIKPANILTDQEGHIKVADFGLAKMHDPSLTSGLTRSNVAMGTPDYVAPEVLTTGLVVDHRADLYAVGVMLYQMLTGEVPRGMFKLPSQKGIGSDPRFDAIICKAMETDREERYQSAGDVRQALETIRTTTLAKKGEAVIPVRSSKPWLAIAVVASVLVVATFFIFGGKPKPSASPASTATALPSIVQGKTIDLLPLVDVKRDAITGEWSRNGADLLVKAAKGDASGSPRLQLPYQPPEEYDFEIEFTPESGDNKVVQILSAYQRAFTWQVDVKLNAGQKAGFTQIDGKSLFDSTDGNTMRSPFLTNGRRHRSTVEVRRTGLRGLLDGQQVVAWGSKPESYQSLDIHANDALHDALHLGLGTYDRAMRFHKITVREVTGTGKVDAGIAVSGASHPDLPPQISAWRDVTSEARENAKTNASLIVTGKGIEKQGDGKDPRLLITPPGQRDQAIRLRYTGGYSQVDLHLCDSGFLYVMAQPNQTIFHSQARGTSAPSVKLIPNKPHPPGFDPKQSHELLVTIEGTRLRAWLDGRFVGEAKADTHTEGATGLTISPGTIVHQVELGEFAAAASSGPPITTWQDVTGTVMEQAKAKPGFSIEGDLIAWTGDKGNPPRIDVTPAGRNDYAIRLKHVGAGQINLRMNEKGFVYVQAAPAGLRINRWMKGVVAPVSLIASQPIPFSYDKGEPHDLTVTVQGSTIRAWLDGQLMGTVEDTTFAEGTGAVALVSYGKVQKVEVAMPAEGALPLADKASSPAVANAAAPSIANWNDVTASVREKARSIPSLVVEADGLRLPDGGPNAATPRMELEAATGDRAVRVRYVGQAQVSLWAKDHTASAFVLAQRDRTMFKRLLDKVATESLLPSVPHPAGFDAGQPHELLLTVQGKVVHVWLDGRFVGEAQDDIFGDSTTALVFIPSSTVQRVEVAKLATAVSSGSWNDWLGPKLATGTFGPPDWKVEKDGLTGEKPISGRTILPGEIRDAAVRVSYDLRDSAGIQVTMREHRGNPNGRELYVADDTGVSLYIARMMPDGTIKSLVNRNYPNQTPRAATRTLEFRCVGETLTATVTGATTEPFVVTATDTALQSGPVSVALKKGVLLKKVETQIFDTPR